MAGSSLLIQMIFFRSSPVASEWTVILGRLNQNGSNPFEVAVNVTNITLSNVTGSNIAVLLLQTSPTLSNYIQPICLDSGQTFAAGLACWIAGWSAQGGGGEPVHSRAASCHLHLNKPHSCLFYQTLVDRSLQESQTSVVNCGNSTANDSICTDSFSLEQVSVESRFTFIGHRHWIKSIKRDDRMCGVCLQIPS